MKYVALLRGINVGGRNTVDMKQLVSAMEKDGFEKVSTYINSGNIFFSSSETEQQLVSKLEALITSEFGLDIKVLFRNKPNIDTVVSSIPNEWSNGAEMKCNVMFLWEKYNDKSVMKQLKIKPEIDEVRYVQGTIIWKADRKNITKSGMMKLPGTDLYAHMTIRNCNTARKIKERLNA